MRRIPLLLPQRKLPQPCASLKKLKKLLLLVPVIALLTWVTHKNVEPSQPPAKLSGVRGSRSEDASFIVYATDDIDRAVLPHDRDNNNNNNNTYHHQPASGAYGNNNNTYHHQPASDNASATSGAKGLKETPFAVEKSYNFEYYTDDTDLQPLDAPPLETLYPDYQSEIVEDAKVPERILQMFRDNDEGEEEKNKPFIPGGRDSMLYQLKMSSSPKAKPQQWDIDLLHQPAPALKPPFKSDFNTETQTNDVGPQSNQNGALAEPDFDPSSVGNSAFHTETGDIRQKALGEIPTNPAGHLSRALGAAANQGERPINRGRDLNFTLGAAANQGEQPSNRGRDLNFTLGAAANQGEKPNNHGRDLSPALAAAAIRKSQTGVAGWEAVMEEREKLVLTVCDKHQKLLQHRTVYDTNSLVNENYRLLYCPVEKSASTFFRRFMFALEHSIYDSPESVSSDSLSGPLGGLSHPGTISFVPASLPRARVPSPLQIPIQMSLEHGYETPRTAYRRGVDLASNEFVKFIVVREPFTRLFSAYVDKLLVPNVYYWKKWGVNIVSRHRKAPTSHSLLCGHDVTFPEFVKYVLSETEKITTVPRMMTTPDPHLHPASSLCSPCDVRYNVIAHVETLREDFEYLTRRKLGVIVANFSFNNMVENMKTDAIVDSVHSAFEFHQHLATCVSKFEMGQRLWAKMQLRGIVRDEVSFPFSQEDIELATSEDFATAVQKARESTRSRDRDKMEAQKFLSLREAYAEVPAEDVRKFVKLFSLDFDLFGYERFPSFFMYPDLL